jgi:methionyl aminopeptidase
LNDGWTIITKDGKASAHFEHNVVVKNNQAEILSDFSIIEAEIKKNKELQEIVA